MTQHRQIRILASDLFLITRFAIAPTNLNGENDYQIPAISFGLFEESEVESTRTTNTGQLCGNTRSINSASETQKSTSVSRLMSQLYQELRNLASRSMRQERQGHTLQTTELVHEAYLRLADQGNICEMDPVHFRAATANTMRRILVDYARSRNSQRRGGGAAVLPLDELVIKVAKRGFTLPALDEALERLAELDPRKSRVIELRFFAGLTVDEVAKVLCVHRCTVERDWTFARSWLRSQLFDD